MLKWLSLPTAQIADINNGGDDDESAEAEPDEEAEAYGEQEGDEGVDDWAETADDQGVKTREKEDSDDCEI